MTQTHIIIGPTASGKSNYSLELAQKESAHIISADAFQIYTDFNIGTGTLTDKEMEGIPHYLINSKSPNEPYSVQEFLDKTQSIIQKLSHLNIPIIICGGSAMYLKALLYGYRPLKRLPIHERPTGDPKTLWESLHAIDPDLANKTPYQNTQRVQRYLELHMIYNVAPSTLFVSKPFDPTLYKVTGIQIETELLKKNIHHRIDTMLHNGWVDEVQQLMKKYDTTSPAFSAIGYKEIIQWIEGKINKSTMITTIKQKTCQYAKRQMTWFRTFEHVNWIS